MLAHRYLGQLLILAGVLLALLGCATGPQLSDTSTRQAVIDTELAFAKTMADRDFSAFSTFIADEAIFLQHIPLKGKANILAHWKALYKEKAAPFSWRPEEVQVLESGRLAISTGPVTDPAGKITHTFTSIWRLRADGKWEIIFDQGNPICDGKK